MQRSLTGRRRNSMMLFILFLVGAILILVKRKAKAGMGTMPPAELQTAINRLELSNADNWMAVAKMETAGFSSGGFIHALNPWGMHQAKIRPEHQLSTYQGTNGEKIASYTDFNDAVLDLMDWIDYTDFPKYNLSLIEHIEEMKARNYFPQSANDYLALVLAWQKR